MYTIRVHVLCTHVRSHVHDLKYTEWKIHEKSTRFEKRFTTRNRVLEYAVPWYSGKKWLESTCLGYMCGKPEARATAYEPVG